MEQLGLDVDTRRLCVTYPPSKRAGLLAIIDIGWAPGSQHPQRRIATLLGHTRMASTILPIGSYFYIHLQQWLNDCLSRLIGALTGDHTVRVKAAWRSIRTFRTPAPVAHDIALIRSYLLSPSADTI